MGLTKVKPSILVHFGDREWPVVSGGREAACRNPNLHDAAGKRPAPRLLRLAPPGPIESEGTPLGIAQVLLRNSQTTDDR